MSVIIAIVIKTFGVMASDGRATRNGIIITENARKMVRLGKHLVIGYTGMKGFAEDLVHGAFPDQPYNETSVEVAFNMFTRYCNTHGVTAQGNDDAHAQFVICGISETGLRKTSTIGIDRDGLTVINDAGPVCIAGATAVDNVLEILQENSGASDGNIETVLNATIHDISLIDKSVNDHVFLEFV